MVATLPFPAPVLNQAQGGAVACGKVLPTSKFLPQPGSCCPDLIPPLVAKSVRLVKGVPDGPLACSTITHVLEREKTRAWASRG